MYEKKVSIQPDKENLRRLIQETCVAEIVHYQLIILSLPVLRIWPGAGGVVSFSLCVVGNLAFSILQRHIKALQRLEQQPKTYKIIPVCYTPADAPKWSHQWNSR